MDQYDIDLLSTQQDNRRKVKLVKNGDPSQMTSCLVKEYINFEQLAETICESIDVSKREAQNIRVFKTGGIEVFNEDVQYIKNNDILYISFGEEFDESSNFAVFKLLRCLGEGGYGRVFEARNRISKEKVAIKMIDSSKIKNAKDTDMIYKELIALKNLNHRNIVKVYNCYTLQKEQKVALILEYLDGGDLREYLNEKKILPEKEAQKLFIQLYSAIQYCHRENIIHRDLKLENIMFEDKGKEKLKVVDFGISGRQTLVYVDHTEAGSARYLSPEVITQHFPAHPCIDVWAMGCILFWMLTGNSPFPQNTRDAVQDSILKGKWSFSPADKKKLTRSVQDLIKKMLIINHNQRITMNEIGEHRWIQNFYEEIVQLELEEDEQKKKCQQEKSQQSEDAKLDSPQVLAPIKKKAGQGGSITPLQKSSNANSQQSLLNGGYAQSSRNPYSIQPIRKNSMFNNSPVFKSPQHHSNASQRSLQQYSIFSQQNGAQQGNQESRINNNNQDNNRLILPKIDQKGSSSNNKNNNSNNRRFSYEPQTHISSQNNFNTPRNLNSIQPLNLNLRKESLFKNNISTFRQASPSQSQFHSPKPLKSVHQHENIAQLESNQQANQNFKSMNDLGNNLIKGEKSKAAVNASFIGKNQLKTKE
ncbi:hypothetical protein ABPG73_001595 [Tetrahymena malaccensis]